MTEKRQCLFGCDKYGTWQTGMCPTCRSYLHRAENRPMRWRIQRRETVERWQARLERVIKEDSRGKIVPMRRAHGRRSSA